ncbi:MAG TPA: LysR family transcriptional regulator [Pseudolabrys sp.]|nr:LysR family transcriptional regulator [Pseudolabrys sp.]
MRGTEFTEMSAFAAVAEHRSFAKAANKLGVARSTLSQNLRSLEDRLGVRLLNRTTRSVSLTQAGERLLTRLRPVLAELAAATGDLDGFRKRPSGLLRVVVQPPVASLLMGPLLGRFLEEYPDITLDLSVVRMPTDIVSAGFDAGIRFGEQVDRDMIAMRVMNEARFVVVAAPKYLARHPAPKTPADLQHHNCIRSMLPNGTVFGWEFQKKDRRVHAKVNGTLIVDDIDLSIQAVLGGVGLAYLLHDYIAADIARGRLVPVLEDWTPRLSGFFLYYSSRRQMTPALRALVDFLKVETKRRGISPTAAPSTRISRNYVLLPRRFKTPAPRRTPS